MGYRNFEGVDIGKEQIEFCKAHVTDKVKKIESISCYLKEHTDTFDLIVMNDVLEHIPKDEILDVLSLIRESLRQTAKLIIKTANMSSFSGLHLRYKVFDHEMGFSEFSFYQVLLASGFETIELTSNKASFSLRPKHILWLLIRKIWFFIFTFIYLLELGTERPRILTTSLIAIASK